MIEVTNNQFLKELFGPSVSLAHITSFTDDPSNIPNERRGLCWAGGYYENTHIVPLSNQYYTISTFRADKDGKARRRKGLFRAMHVVVADDVKEKLPIDRIELLPAPTFKLQTSPGSEQWGWVLDVPCREIDMCNNLLDGLVAQGLAPDGKDPGMGS